MPKTRQKTERSHRARLISVAFFPGFESREEVREQVLDFFDRASPPLFYAVEGEGYGYTFYAQKYRAARRVRWLNAGQPGYYAARPIWCLDDLDSKHNDPGSWRTNVPF